MSFVIDKQGDYLPVFGESAGGANATYIPENTTYTVKTDGTGDFSLLSEAITFLQNKWSSGTVTIDIGAGTYEDGKISISQKLIGFPDLVIKGAGKDNTIIHNTSTSQAVLISNFRNKCTFQDLTFENTNVTTPFSVFQLDFANATIKNVKLENGQYTLFVGGGYSQLVMNGTVDIQNSSTAAIGVQQQSSILANQITLNIDTAPLAISILRLATFIFAAGTQNYTSVTTQYSQTVNTITKEGCIYKD